MGVVPGARDKHIPGVWKLMRLISTGSLGWWGARSALFRRHLVRGSESFRLLCVSRQIEMCDPAVCDSASHNHTQTHVQRLEQLGSCSSRGQGATPAPVLSLQRAGPVLTYQAYCSRKQTGEKEGKKAGEGRLAIKSLFYDCGWLSSPL